MGRREFEVKRAPVRDNRPTMIMRNLEVSAREDMRTVAQRQRRACRQLRDKVDEIDLATMGVAE